MKKESKQSKCYNADKHIAYVYHITVRDVLSHGVCKAGCSRQDGHAYSTGQAVSSEMLG